MSPSDSTLFANQYSKLSPLDSTLIREISGYEPNWAVDTSLPPVHHSPSGHASLPSGHASLEVSTFTAHRAPITTTTSLHDLIRRTIVETEAAAARQQCDHPDLAVPG